MNCRADTALRPLLCLALTAAVACATTKAPTAGDPPAADAQRPVPASRRAPPPPHPVAARAKSTIQGMMLGVVVGGQIAGLHGSAVGGLVLGLYGLATGKTFDGGREQRSDLPTDEVLDEEIDREIERQEAEDAGEASGEASG